MNKMQIFSSPSFGQVRVSIGTDNQPVFCLADICGVLGINNVGNVKSRLDEDDIRQTDVMDSIGRTQKVIYVTEEGFYDVVIRSDSPIAKPFRRWVTHEVLPSIRKTGQYCTGKPRQDTGQMLNAKMKVASWVIKTLNLSEASKLAIAKSIADPLGLPTPDYVKTPDATAAASQLLKECGAKMSALAFNRMLVQQGYLAEMERTAAKGMRKTFKCITKKGLYYGENGVSPHNPKETQPRWYVSKFKDLLSVVTNNIKEKEANNG